MLLKTVQYKSFVVEDFNKNVILVIELTSSILPINVPLSCKYVSMIYKYILWT